MPQLPLFDRPVAQARQSDVLTSHEAAAAHEQSGKAGVHRERVYAAIGRIGGGTYREIAREAGLDPVETIRRIGDLQRTRKVKKWGFRICSVCLRKCSVFVWDQ
jgi:hypothetical protein